ncbi:DEAD/DEAH box helicase [Xanthobacter autotrophicus]|uniref:DEAD/DEAH box helicase n=1 Tax=Xanthobacter autotrophicus TaxID=280 RepID=UPI00372AD24B
MAFDCSFSEDSITLTLRPEKAGLLGGLLRRRPARDLEKLSADDRDLMLALADLRALGDAQPGTLEITSDQIRLPHALAAALDGRTAERLGLPPVVDLTLRTDVDGLVGSPGFRLRHEWVRHGQRQLPQRVGAILKTSAGLRRLPLWLMQAVEIAEGYKGGGTEAEQWAALARFRQALDPGVSVGEAGAAARVSMTDFLSGLQVRIADRFSLSPNAALDDFDIVPFDGHRLERDERAEDQTVSEQGAELAGAELSTFQARFRNRGALPAYRLGPSNYLVIDGAAAPALQVMAQMQRAPASERADFIRNPRPKITEAVIASLREQGRFEGLSEAAAEELIEQNAGPLFVETAEFSARVVGLKVFEKSLEKGEASGTSWLPETFAKQLAQALSALPAVELEAIRDRVETAIATAAPSVEVAGFDLPTVPEARDLVAAHLAAAVAAEQHGDGDDATAPAARGPIVLDAMVNFEELRWDAALKPRPVAGPCTLPPSIRTPLKGHQAESFAWQVKAWAAGLPGILNADEQGLGKTLQTIAFLAWLKSQTARPEAEIRGPILVVAPTSLLQNWEKEVAQHTDAPGLGHLIRLYGAAISTRKRAGLAGKDIDSGEGKLDFDALHEAIAEGRGHRYWVLTTYTTLTNYQHSLARIPFAAVVFDEIQTLKNPDSLRAHAGRTVNADFRIGLTGTPIENSAVDLWAIMDQLAGGKLGTYRDFRGRYEAPDEVNMAELHGRVFGATERRPALALRREKDGVARDLPTKSRKLHPRLMPQVQAQAYEHARLKLAEGGPGAALKMLHHIRTVSVHPDLEGGDADADVIAASGRVEAAFAILRTIAAAQEKALVFIEHRQMQYRFIELVKAVFGLKRVDLINGDTPIDKRQAIVDRFQGDGPGFDLLVLGPKAAGTGLTLTAATHVIHLSRWWNPAVEEQCNDRVHRIGQTRPVTVHVPMAIHPGYREHSFDCLLHSLMQRKRRLARSALWPMGDTQADVGDLQRMLGAEMSASTQDPLRAALAATYLRDEQPLPAPDAQGAYAFG